MRLVGLPLRLVFVFVAIALSDAARATIALLPIDMRGLGSDENRAREAFLDALRNVLKSEIKIIPDGAVPEGSVRCTASAACLQRVAPDANEILSVRVERASGGPDEWGRAVFVLVTTTGAEIGRFEATLSTTGAARDVRGLVLRVFDPARYNGRLDLRGTGAGDVILIDGLRAAQASMNLRAGPHTVRVIRTDGSSVELQCEVPFEDRVAVDVPPPLPAPATENVARTPPWWAVGVHGVVAGVSAFAIVAWIVQDAGLASFTSVLERQACPPAADDPLRVGFSGQGAGPFGACLARQVRLHQWAQMNHDLDLLHGLAFGAIGVAAVSAAVVTGMRAADADDDPDAAPP